MLTLTASSVPDGDRLSPVDHLDAIHDAFSYGGVRDTLRNTLEYHLGLDSDDWGYWLQAEPHGMGSAADDGERTGMNACYTHLHVGVYFDAAATSLDLRSVGSEFERVIDKHVAECDSAGVGGHDYTSVDDYLADDTGCISLNADVQNLGSYLAAYMGGYTEELLDKPIEYLAWGALYWSAARRRTSRSQTVNQAICADRCEQRAENEETGQVDPHGERIRWDDGHGADVVCSCCGSPWTIDQDRLDGPPEPETALDDDLRWAAGATAPPPNPEPDRSLAERWPSADSAWSYGESPRKALIRERVQGYLDVHGQDVSLPSILAHLNIDPSYKEFVGEVLNGTEQPESESIDRRRREPQFGYELKAIVDADGNEHQPGGGGVDMVQLELPVAYIIENTRLANDLAQGEIFRNGRTGVATHDPETIARGFVNNGITDPDVADRLLIVDDYHVSNPDMDRDEPRPCMLPLDER
ncbi:ORF1 [Halorubrum sp. DM2]|nr:ORF1 [Halorubrum sp. DM2]